VPNTFIDENGQILSSNDFSFIFSEYSVCRIKKIDQSFHVMKGFDPLQMLTNVIFVHMSLFVVALKKKLTQSTPLQ